MSDDPNILHPEWQHEHLGVRAMRIGVAAGAHDLGCSVCELEPGAMVAPYHLHHGNEELLIVLSGTPELRTPDGTRTLEPGAVVSFRAGPEGAHRLRNASDAPCHYLMVSTMRFPEVAEYPETGAILAMRGPGSGWAWPAGADHPRTELVREAVQAEPE